MFFYSTFLCIFSFFCSVFWRKHLIRVFISLELFILGVCMVFYFFFRFIGFCYAVIYFLVLMVCEGVVGLRIIVYYIRCVGWDGCGVLGSLG